MSGLYSVEDLLDPQYLSPFYSEIASANMNNPFLQFYAGSGGIDNPGDIIEMTYFPANKTPVPLNKKGSPAKTQSLIGAQSYFHKPIHIFNELTLPLHSVMNMRAPDSQAVDPKGRAEIDRQFKAFVYRQNLARSVAISKAFANGVIYVDPDGVILESSSGAELTIDLQVPAGHKSQLDYNGGGAIINTAGDNSAALILEDLRQIRVAAEEQNAEYPNHVWMHSTGLGWLRANTEIKAYIQGGGSPERTEYLLNGYGASGTNGVNGVTFELGGYTWHFYDGTYTASDGTVKPLIPTTKAIITPDPNPTWFRNYNGMEIVPTQVGVFGGFQEALNSVGEIYGDFAYATIGHNPPKISIFAGTNFLYAFANPNAVWMPTVDF